MTAWFVGAMVMVAADIATTWRALELGGVESNPLLRFALRHCKNDSPRDATIVFGAINGVLIAALWYYCGFEPLAWIVVGVIHALAASWNMYCIGRAE